MEGNDDFIRIAIGLATQNVLSGGGGPFGAVVVKHGEVVATGVNQVTASNDPTAHAEIIAIRNACLTLHAFQLQGCTIYSSCEPCPMCLAAILWSRCDAVYFGGTAADAAAAGFDDASFYEEVCRTPTKRSLLPSRNLLREEAQESFTAWSKFNARVDY